MLERFSNLRFTIVGKDKPAYRALPKGVPPLGETARKRYKSLGFDSRVTIINRLDTASYRNLLQSSDIHFYFSKPFVASWSLLEAMSSGCTIVASDIEMVREFVLSGNTRGALLVDHMQHKQVVKSVSQLIQSKELRSKLSANARNLADRYSKNKCLDSLCEVLGL